MFSASKVRRVGLMGPFGYGNLGDAATQDAMIEHVRKWFPGAEIFGFSLNPKDTEARHGIKSFPISWQSWEDDGARPPKLTERLAERLKAMDRAAPRQLARLILRAPRELDLVRQTFDYLGRIDVLIISGGGQLEDYWGHGPWSYPYTFLKWCSVARLVGVRVFLVSVGAGPITAEASKKFISWGLSLTEYRSYRDSFSKRLIQSIGFKHDDPVCPDLAFSLDTSGIAPAPRPGARGRLVGIGPVGYFKKGCWPEHDAAVYENYLEKMACFIEWLVARGHEVVFLPGEVHYDQMAIGDLLDRLLAKRIDVTKVHRPGVATVNDLLSQLSAADIVVSSRFHMLLLAQVLGKPGIGLSYQEKIDSLMQSAGQGANCFPIGKFDVDSLKERFATILASYESTSRGILEWSGSCKEILEAQYRRVFGAMSS